MTLWRAEDPDVAALLIRRNATAAWTCDGASKYDVEQTARMPDLRLGVTGSMRTPTDAGNSAAVRTRTATAVRHGRDARAVLADAARERPWISTFA